MSVFEKIDPKSKDLVSENIKFIKEHFQGAVTETEDGLKINKDLLLQALSKDLVEGTKEKYELSWPGKSAAKLAANIQTTNTFEPVIEESVDFENTENLYIEGDNLEVLKILQKSYTGNIKCIYIDPPYNTGKDFVYKDSFSQAKNDYLIETGQKNEEGTGKLVSNPETSGRYHSNWLSMMYPRLSLARNLLTDDGVIFISIDDSEQANLKRLCDEIFGEDSFINNIIWHYGKMSNEKKKLANNHEYIYVYGKSTNSAILGTKKEDSEYKNRYLRFLRDDNTIRYLDLKNSSDALVKGRIKKRLEELKKTELNDEDILFDFKYEFKSHSDTVYISTIKGNSEENVSYFDSGQKPIELIKLLIGFYEKANKTNDYYILDFFSGSGTTANAVLSLNSIDKGKRKYIMVQIPEETPEDSEAHKAGYKTICEIGKERIRRAGKKIKEETNADIDYGFRVLKLTESVINENSYKSPQETNIDSLFENNLRDNLKPETLIFYALLDLGLPLTYKFELKEIDNHKVYFVEDNSLVCCFDKDIKEQTLLKFLESNPLYLVVLDSSFSTDQDKINLKNKIVELNLRTTVKVI